MSEHESHPGEEPQSGGERLELPASQGSIRELVELAEPFLPPRQDHLPPEARALPESVTPAGLARLPDGRVLWVSGKTVGSERELHLKFIERGARPELQAETDVSIWAGPDGYHISPSQTTLEHNPLADPDPPVESQLWEEPPGALHGAAEAELLDRQLIRDGMTEDEVQDLIADVRSAERFDPFA